MRCVQLNGVNKKIKNREVLSDINLNLEIGKIYGFSGSNGSGKTMLFRVIAGLVKPTSGEVKLFNEVLHKDITFPRSIGIIIEYPGLLNQFTVFENLKILASIKNEITDEQIKESISKVDLDPNDKRKVKEYSLGMRQRVGIAQAIMEKPDLILLDEPTNGLDEEGIHLVHNLLIEEKERGASILIASHNKFDLEVLSDEIFKIHEGRVLR